MMLTIRRVNISNANVFGLSEDLGLEGVQYNVALVIFFVPVSSPSDHGCKKDANNFASMYVNLSHTLAGSYFISDAYFFRCYSKFRQMF